MPRPVKNIISIGDKFTRLTVVSKTEKPKYFLCECDCGKIKEIRKDHLYSGKTLSCGCLKDAQARERASVLHNANISHGMSSHPLYNIWRGIKQRCLNPSSSHFNRYGGRGITICEQWRDSFEQFLNDMGVPNDGQTIDRINNELGYFPENCRWATRKEQSNNISTNHKLTYKGQTLNIAQWAELKGMPYNTLRERIVKGWDIDRAINTKPRTAENRTGLALGAKASSIARKARTHCKNGHEFTDAVDAKGNRRCKKCHADRQRNRRH